MELEENREIPFLDVCIKRDHNTFQPLLKQKKYNSYWSEGIRKVVQEFSSLHYFLYITSRHFNYYF